jgi:signal transduction histidine kinase
VLLALLDVSLLKQAEMELRGIVRAREDFIAVGSHELRTPLTALKLQLGNALRTWTKPELAASRAESVAGYLRHMQGSIERLERLSEYLLDISRISAGSLQLSRARVDLGALAKDVVERFDADLTHAGCKRRLAVSGEVVGYWDRMRLDQALGNLLANAIKYAPGCLIEVEVRGTGERVLLLVRDHGPGIPQERQARLFDRFERATQADDARGFGLGLWIVREIVMLHGGSVGVVSKPGEGACFTIDLPRG